MTRHLTRILLAAGMAATLCGQSPAATFQLVAQLDTAALNAGVPGSVAAYGDTLYIGGLFAGGQLHRISNPLGAASNAATFGGGLPAGSTNGYVSLNTDGTTLVAATNNGGGAADVVQVYNFATNALNWASDSATLGITAAAPNDRIDGAAVDPINGHVLLTGFGSGTQHLRSAAAPGSAIVGATSSLFDGGTGNTGTGFRDVDFDNATGDIYLRAVNGVARGNRVGVTLGDYTRLDETTAGVQTIVQLADGFNSAINVEFLPANFAGGQELVIMNFRNGANTFNDQVRVYDATTVNGLVAANFVGFDGVTPFTTANAASGIYDFSYDPVNAVLYVSDFSTSQVHAFRYVPEPSALALLAAAAPLLARRRR